MKEIDTKRFLLCRPEGGLNDILCQIQKCYSYAKRWKRILIIDTNYTGANSFKDKFSNYFYTKERDVYLDIDKLKTIELMPVYPNFIQDRVNTYRAEWSTRLNSFVDNATQQSLNLDFEMDYAEQLVLHHSAGGGEKSVRAFAWLRLNQVILNEISSRIEKIGAKYTAIHIRHTDYKTNYKKKIQALANKIKGPIYIASDNRTVVEYCTQVFGIDRTFSLSILPNQAGEKIHIYEAKDILHIFDNNKDAIADLFTLALSKNLYIFNIETNDGKLRYSGFSRLAKNLRLFNRFVLSINHINNLKQAHLIKSRGTLFYCLISSYLWKAQSRIARFLNY